MLKGSHPVDMGVTRAIDKDVSPDVIAPSNTSGAFRFLNKKGSKSTISETDALCETSCSSS